MKYEYSNEMLFRRILSWVDPEQVLILKLNRVKNSSLRSFTSELDEKKLNFISQNTQVGGLILEFGAGGSTLELLKRGFRVTSIESDRHFARKINEAAMNEFGVSPVVYANIGLTGNYGFPASHLVFFNRLLGRFNNYVNQVQDDRFNTIIIDGRFRVSTFLAAAIFFENKPTLVVIDDYKDRGEYHVLEEIIKFDGQIGGLAYYYSKKIKDLNAARNLLNVYIGDPR